MNREHLKSRLGFILLSAGCAIGIGNVWKFPYVVGENGGGAFVLIYLFFLLIMGVPILSMEFSLGRASQKSPVKLYPALKPNQKGWQLHGYACLVGSLLLMMFYTIVAGWMLQYFTLTATGTFDHASVSEVANIYQMVTSNPQKMIFYSFIIIFFYTYTGIIGKDIPILSIGSFFVSIILGEYLAYKIMNSNYSCDNSIAMIVLTLLFVCFVNFTFFPPKIGLFKDPLTNTFGIFKNI